MIGPWRLIRFFLRTILWGFLTWLVLAILWAILPFPSYEHEGDNGSDYATSMLLSGNWLTRVYLSPSRFGVYTDRRGIVLDYRLNVDNLTLEIGGYGQLLPILIPESIVLHHSSGIESFNSMQNLNVTVRAGDEDGANLPWFAKPDAVLLYWAIHKDNSEVPLVAQWFEQDGLTTLTLMSKAPSVNDLFEIKIEDKDPKSIVATVPEVPESGSPSMTYIIRLVLIFFIAPTTVFVNDNFGFIIKAVFNAAIALVVVGLWGFLILAVVISCWRSLGGPSLETTVAWTIDRLNYLNQGERLRGLRIDELKEALEGLKEGLNYDDVSWAQWLLQICRVGWHPERVRVIREQAKADLERNIASAKPTVSTKTPGKEVHGGNATSSTEVAPEKAVADIDATEG